MKWATTPSRVQCFTDVCTCGRAAAGAFVSGGSVWTMHIHPFGGSVGGFIDLSYRIEERKSYDTRYDTIFRYDISECSYDIQH